MVTVLYFPHNSLGGGGGGGHYVFGEDPFGIGIRCLHQRDGCLCARYHLNYMRESRGGGTGCII